MDPIQPAENHEKKILKQGRYFQLWFNFYSKKIGAFRTKKKVNYELL